MKRLRKVALILTSVLAGSLALAGSWASNHAFTAGAVAVTNTQANSAWAPVAVLVRYAAPAAGTVTVHRASAGVVYTLAVCAFTNAQTVVWIPEAPYVFEPGDALLIGSSETNGVVQVIRKGGG